MSINLASPIGTLRIISCISFDLNPTNVTSIIFETGLNQLLVVEKVHQQLYDRDSNMKVIFIQQRDDIGHILGLL